MGTRPLTESLGYGYAVTMTTDLDLPPVDTAYINDGSTSTGIAYFNDETQGAGTWHRWVGCSWAGPVRIDAISMDTWGTDPTTMFDVAPAAGAWTTPDDDGWALGTDPYTWTPTDPMHVTEFEFTATYALTGLTYVALARFNEVVVRGEFYPWAAFSGTPLLGSAPLEVAFTDLSEHAPTSWLWDFGDGTTSTEQNPTHVYTEGGVYTVALTVSNHVGETTETKNGYVIVRSAGLALDVYKVNPPGDTVTFLATLDGAFDKAIRPVLSDVGSGSFSISRYDPDATPENLAPGNIVKVRIPVIDETVPVFAFILETGDFTLASTDEEGGEILRYGGRGVLAYWDWARWLGESYVIPWWDAGWPGLVGGKPPANALGHLVLAGGDTFWRYTITNGKIASRTEFTVTGGDANEWYDHRQAFKWASGTSKAGTQQTLVQIDSGGSRNNYWISPYESGVTDVRQSSVLGIRCEFGEIGEANVTQWWDDLWGTPPEGTLGRVSFAAGTYYHYNLVGTPSQWNSRDTTTTSGFSAWYDARRRVAKVGSTSKITLVRLSSGSRAGFWMRPSQAGVRDWQAKEPTGTFIPGKVLRRILDEVQGADRPSHPLELMTTNITETEDSDGNDWTSTPSLLGITADIGESYLSTVAKIVATGLVDVEMTPDMIFHAANSIGRDLSGDAFGTGVVRFVKGVNIGDEVRREASGNGPKPTFTQVVGDDAFAQAMVENAAAQVAREMTTRASGTDAVALAEAGAEDLERVRARVDAVGFPVVPGNDPASGLYLPGPPGTARGHYWLGDLVSITTGTGDDDYTDDALRVVAVTLAEDEAGQLTVLPELASELGNAESAALGQGAGAGSTTGGSGSGGTSSGGSTGSGTVVSAPPTSTVDPSAYQEVSERGVANGYAPLDSSARLPVSAAPALSVLVGAAEGIIDEIVVGLTPGGELGGSWASPTVDAVHSGSSHHAEDHAARHASGGADSVKLDDLAAPDDNTDLNASTSAHGLLPKLPGGTSTFLRGDGTFVAPPGASGGDTTGQIILGWDGGGSVVTGEYAEVVAPFAGTITGWTLLADAAGSVSVDVRKDTYANFPPTGADSIVASAPPVLSSQQKAASTTLTGWTTAIAAGDVIRAVPSGVSIVTRLLLVIDYSRP